MIPFSEDQIRDRARALWEGAGQPEGRDMEFWLEAEQQFAERADEEFEPEDHRDDNVIPAYPAAE